MPTIQYPKHPNTDTAFVIQDDGKKNRALMIAPQDITSLELPENPNSTKGYVTVSGKKQRVVLTADISGSGGGAVTSVNGKTGAVVLTAEDINAIPQLTTMPTASADLNGAIVQYTGATDATYTNGYFYKCAGAGEPVVYSWTQTNVQPAPVIPDPLPSQTGNAGKFLTTDGTDASWSDKPLVNKATGNYSLSILGEATNKGTGIIIGDFATGATGSGSAFVVVGVQAKAGNAATAIGKAAEATAVESIAIGNAAKATANGAVQIKSGTNSTANTVQVGSYTVLSADGTVPTARLTKVNTTITLTAADWSSSTQTVTVNGITSTSVVFVAPDPTDVADYVAGGILCTAQGTNSLTFTCSATPANDIDVVIVAM